MAEHHLTFAISPLNGLFHNMAAFSLSRKQDGNPFVPYLIVTQFCVIAKVLMGPIILAERLIFPIDGSTKTWLDVPAKAVLRSHTSSFAEAER